MSMFKCPECKSKVSTGANACPRCGYVLTDSDKQIERQKVSKPWYKKWWGIALIVFIALVALGALLPSDNSRESTSKATSTSKAETPGQAEFNEGLVLYYQDKDEAAVELFQKALEKGHRDAEGILGTMYAFGFGAQKDTKKGLSLIQSAADKGSAWGLQMLGSLYVFGELGLTKDAATGIKLIERSIETGEFYGYTALASLYERGAGVNKDLEKAQELYREAGKRGYPLADHQIQKIKNLPDHEVSLKDFFNSYKNNEVAADQKYKGKKIRITGTIESINKSVGDRIYIVMRIPGTYFDSVQFHMKKETENQAASLSKGQRVTIQGIGDTMIIGTPMIKECWFPKSN